MTIAELKRRKRELGYTNARVSELSGIPLSTVQKVLGGTTAAPREETLRAIEAALFPERAWAGIDNTGTGLPESARAVSGASNSDVSNSGSTEGILYAAEMQRFGRMEAPAAIREPDNLAYRMEGDFVYAGKKQGEYTVEDYYRLPDDVRAELIDGRLYNMAAPTTIHQYLGQAVLVQMMNYRRTSKCPCMPLLSPVDVQLDSDNRTMAQPDLIVVCERQKARIKNIYGAPEFVMEVLSPSSWGRDKVLKLNKYWRAGVQEYWIVDPEHEEVTVYHFADGRPPDSYTFDDTIPVGITDGNLQINFAEIVADIRDFFGEEANQ